MFGVKCLRELSVVKCFRENNFAEEKVECINTMSKRIDKLKNVNFGIHISFIQYVVIQ